MVARTLRRLLWAVLWVVLLPTMTLAVGIPACLWLMSRQSKGTFPAFVGWIAAAQAGWLPPFTGPFGLPHIVFWPSTILFTVWFTIGFTIMAKAAWSEAVISNQMMRNYRTPPSQIV